MTLSESYWPADTSSPVHETTVGDLIREAGRDDPDGIAFIEGLPDPQSRRRTTYAELLAASEAVARALLQRFEPG